ncbi:hypothetical protein VNO78_00377 [Psophocarpus tetragonolobus]|uniref:Uncharacterized protein n=1 Tax=Psophocarpus tetragonolobus TaxID=3891 RepID=A0AAN9XTR4_PSOTE
MIGCMYVQAIFVRIKKKNSRALLCMRPLQTKITTIQYNEQNSLTYGGLPPCGERERKRFTLFGAAFESPKKKYTTAGTKAGRLMLLLVVL